MKRRILVTLVALLVLSLPARGAVQDDTTITLVTNDWVDVRDILSNVAQSADLGLQMAPDASGKVLFVYGPRRQPTRHVAVVDVGSTAEQVLFTVEDGTAGVSPLVSGFTGAVGLNWCNDDTLFVAVDAGHGVLLLRM